MSTKTGKDTEVANVYIFNKIQNNGKDIELLKKTFASLGCIVTEVKNQTYTKLKRIVASIISANFTALNYIVIIVLDNENEEEFIWKTTDDKEFQINGDLTTAIYANVSLAGKLHFSIRQNNRVTEIEVKKLILNTEPPSKKPKREPKPNMYNAKRLKYFATSAGCVLTHKWSDNVPSPFITILCDEIQKNLMLQRPLEEILNCSSDRVNGVTGEVPCVENSGLEGLYVLGNARV